MLHNFISSEHRVRMGTPRRRLLVSELRNNFSMPLASSTPKKHEDDESSNNEEDPITIIEVPRRNYRREIRLLRLRLDEIKVRLNLHFKVYD